MLFRFPSHFIRPCRAYYTNPLSIIIQAHLQRLNVRLSQSWTAKHASTSAYLPIHSLYAAYTHAFIILKWSSLSLRSEYTHVTIILFICTQVISKYLHQLIHRIEWLSFYMACYGRANRRQVHVCGFAFSLGKSVKAYSSRQSSITKTTNKWFLMLLLPRIIRSHMRIKSVGTITYPRFPWYRTAYPHHIGNEEKKRITHMMHSSPWSSSSSSSTLYSIYMR